jgi:Protein of unknown function (DUF1579)
MASEKEANVTQQEDEQTAFGTPPPDPELGRLAPLVGTWRAEDHTLDSVIGPGVPVTNEETFYWLEGGYYLVQTYETTFGDEPPQKGVNYWMYDSKHSEFRIIFFSNNGPYTEAGNRYAGKVEGSKLTMVGPARFQYDLNEEGKIQTNPDGTVSVAWWLRDENNEWQPWMTNVFTKVTGSA